MNIAITADWLVTYGGAEHVLHELRALFPKAPIFTTVARPASLGPLARADIRTTRLQKWYRLLHQHQVLLPLMPRAIEDIDLRGFDCVISSSHAVAKGVIVSPGTVHICYCHTPMRYAWEMEKEYLHDFKVPRWLQPWVRRRLRTLRRWDLTTAKRTDCFIANSTATQERIERIYNRESTVIPPPVDDRFFEAPLPTGRQPTASPYFLAVGRLVPYKRFDLLIELANREKLPLKIAGRGQDEKRLRKLAGPTVEFLGFVAEEQLPALYQNAAAFLFPQMEDAGIVPLEAQASGTPVIAFRAGGALDVVQDGTTGIFFEQQTLESVQDALQRFKQTSWNRSTIREHARTFSEARFRERMKEEIESAYAEFEKKRERV